MYSPVALCWLCFFSSFLWSIHGYGLFFVDCGGELHQSEGIITSPNFPDYYPNNAHCSWTIVAAQNQVIDLRFTHLDIEEWYGIKRCTDKLLVYDGSSESDPLIAGPFCDNLDSSQLSNLRIRTTGHQMILVFFSDIRIHRKGFSAHFWAHECPPFTYGQDECNNTCRCNEENTVFCKNLNGTCVCKEGWTSTDCSEDVDECSAHTNVCPRDYTACRNTIGGFDCVCEEGLIRNSVHFCEDPKECSEKTCSHACGLTSGGEECYCPHGTRLDRFGGQTCLVCDDTHFGKDCMSICDCVTSNTEFCDKTNGFCYCKPQWTSARCDQDVDECDRYPCDITNSRCYNYEGSFECRCHSGYEKIHGEICEVTYAQKLTMSINSTTLACGRTLTGPYGTLKSRAYYSLAKEDCFWTIKVEEGFIISMKIHVQINYWKSGTFIYIYDGADASASLMGSYGKAGLPYPNKVIHSSGNEIYIVRDSAMDATFTLTYWSHECSKFTHGVNCSSACHCVKANSDYCNSRTGQCICKEGWRSSDCSVDVDECQENPLACPDYTDCRNLEGGFECSCKPGLVTNVVGKCAAPSGNPDCTDETCLHVCVDTGTSNPARVCYCPIGMIYDGNKCVACTNMTYGSECSLVCSCVPKRTAACNPRTGACECLTVWTGDLCSEDIDECSLETHGCQPEPVAECLNFAGGYECRCMEENGYTLGDSGKCVLIAFKA